jgi:hypothetical protein
LFVTPKGLSHDVKIKSFAINDKSGKKVLELVMSNMGGQHALLQNLTLHLKDAKGKAVIISEEKDLQGITGEGILAGKERRFLLALPDKLAVVPTQIDFNFDKDAF